ncbi:ATP-binding cassette domain-containing protein [Hathewaya histolytica]|uniref:Bacitracin ABC transporter ATP-binding protein n=1 Tax=Hathewaya histolytica TaxID=1498 RepID=A0A4U9R227_HATHI|nr:ATP-binding cassette domain-containing protein [Hathewaya histolytica]VTQ85354.1 bacitracin ABC transporter ATP-binding protein [Hathewaya histolytica]
MEDCAVKLYQITKIYGKQKVIDKISINVREGDIYGLIGKNGAGKTTILKLIAGLIHKTSGSMEVLGEVTEQGFNQARRRIGSLIDNPYLYPYFDAKKNLEYYRIQKGLKDKKVVDEILELVGLNNVNKKKFSKYSLGMKQRLGIAQAIMGRPDLLILDEPINGLDPTGIVELRELLLKINRDLGTTIMVSSHILNEMSLIANRYAFIHKGRLIEEIGKGELEKKCRKHLRLKVDNTNKTTVILEKELGIQHYSVLNNNEIEIYEKLNNLNLITKSLIDNNIEIKSVTEDTQTLEDYFIKLLGGI